MSDGQQIILKRAAAGLIVLAALYVVAMVYLSGQLLLGTACLVGVTLTVYIFTSRAAYTYRYLLPGLAGLFVFVVFPLLYTVRIGFTKYQTGNLVTFERATQYFLDRTYATGDDSYTFTLHRDGEAYRIVLEAQPVEQAPADDGDDLDIDGEFDLDELDAGDAGDAGDDAAGDGLDELEDLDLDDLGESDPSAGGDGAAGADEQETADRDDRGASDPAAGAEDAAGADDLEDLDLDDLAGPGDADPPPGDGEPRPDDEDQAQADDAGERFVSEPVRLDGTPAAVAAVALAGSGFEPGEPVGMKEAIELGEALDQVTLQMADGTKVVKASLRTFEPRRPRYQLNDDGSLADLAEQRTLTPNFDTGFFETPDGEPILPGFRVDVGFDHFVRIFTSSELQGPSLRIFAWTVAFALLSVLFTLVIGLLLAELLSWEALRGRGVYQVLLFLPYAIPGFISILVFKGLFDENYGEINLILGQLFGLEPAWFNNPWLARAMILIVNTWLGYPYIMLLGMGLKKSVPGDLYEATAVEGATPLDNFLKITWPLIKKPLMPLLISSFAFNFNNFVLIALLTDGRPDIPGTALPAGETDILVSYTYRIAFQDSGQNLGLAAAISTVIFILVAILSVVNLKLSRVKVDQLGDH